MTNYLEPIFRPHSFPMRFAGTLIRCMRSDPMVVAEKGNGNRDRRYSHDHHDFAIKPGHQIPKNCKPSPFIIPDEKPPNHSSRPKINLRVTVR